MLLCFVFGLWLSVHVSEHSGLSPHYIEKLVLLLSRAG